MKIFPFGSQETPYGLKSCAFVAGIFSPLYPGKPFPAYVFIVCELIKFEKKIHEKIPHICCR